MKRAITILLAAILLLALAACGGESGNTPSADTSTPSGGDATTPAVTPSPTPTSTPEPTPAPQTTFEKIVFGQVYQTDDCEVTINNITVNDNADITVGNVTYSAHSPSENNTFIIIECSVKNLMGDTLVTWQTAPFTAYALYNEKYKYEGERFGGDSDIKPLSTNKLNFTIEVPAEVANATESLTAFITIGNNTYQYEMNGETSGNENSEQVEESSSESGRKGSLWELFYYVDNFNQPTDEAYIMNQTSLVGTFSNSATTDSALFANVIVDKENMSIMLYEYMRNLVKNSSSRYDKGYDIQMKTADGSIIDMTGFMPAGGDRIVIDEKYRNDVVDALSALPVGNVAAVYFYIVETDTPTTVYLLAAIMSNFGDVYSTLT